MNKWPSRVVGAQDRWILTQLMLLLVTPLIAITLENSGYRVSVDDQASFQVSEKSTGTVYRFEPQFVILSSPEDPELRLRQADLPINYNVPTWRAKGPVRAEDVFRKKERSEAQYGDGFDDSILSQSADSRTANLFAAAPKSEIRASRIVAHESSVEFVFATGDAYDFKARLKLPPAGPPELEYTIRPHTEGYYSVGYTGAPEFALAEVDEIWQPLIWGERRFPGQSYLTMAFRCPLPAAMVQESGNTVAVLADPAEYPFDPLPTFERSRFGVAVRNEDGHAQPMIFAPVLGGSGSALPVGEDFSFTLRLVVESSSIIDAYETIARRDFGFHDYRSNELGSINSVIDRMVDYGMSEYANFITELKGCSYSTDVPDAVKNVSSLNPLNMALLRDDARIFADRAYPIIEYMLSREKFLFALDRQQKIQNPSRKMAGPAAPLSELASLYRIGQGANPLLLRLANELSRVDRILNLDEVVPGDRWQNNLALFQATGSEEFLAKARAQADAYIKKYIETSGMTFEHKPFFWTQFVADFPWLCELYETTGEDRYIQAAKQAARRFCFYIWMSPAIPEGPVLVNKGNEAPVYWYLKRFREAPLEIPEEWAPAWRLSEIGLTPESTGTSTGHRAIFMANFAPWLLRIAYHTGDSFLHDVARSAVVGRYRNFPGYHINTDRTTIYEKSDYPLKGHSQLNVNSFHYNHIWPQISQLFDFLVTDAMVKSGGDIEFPSTFIEGYAYLQNRFYGHKPGKFYAYTDAILWMPRDLFQSTSVQLNGISARGNGRVYFAFMNQCNDSVSSLIFVNRPLLNAAETPLPVEMWLNNQRVECSPLVGDTIEVQVPPHGIVAFAIGDTNPEARFQDSILGLSNRDAWETDYIQSDFGGMRAMILNWGPEQTNAYVYLQADDSVCSRTELEFLDGTILVDESYPFEFTIPLKEDREEFSFRLRLKTVEGGSLSSEQYTLKKNK